MSECTIDECKTKCFAKGLCNKHYMRVRKFGSTKNPTPTILERFERKFIPITETGCWIWIGSTSSGYGSFNVNYVTHRANRVSWSLYKGEIPSGLCVLHKCDTSSCVNPEHLFLGTQKDNITDMIKKGRAKWQGKGDKNVR